MGFLDKLSDSISAGGAKVAEKTKELAELAKLSAQIDKANKTAEQTLIEIAKALYADSKDELAAKYPELVEKLDATYAEIATAQEAVRKLKGIVVCPQCGKEVQAGITFCPGCGAKMPEVEAPVAEEAAPTEVECPACHEKLPVGTAFCTKCGAKIGE